MIAVLHSLPAPVRILKDMMRNVRRTVEGPFDVVRANDNEDQSWRFFQVPEGTETHYAAARLAGRRGADRIIVLAPVLAAPGFLEEHAGLYEWLMPNRIVSMKGIERLQSLMPATAMDLPAPMPEPLISSEYKTFESASGEDLILASLPLPLTIPALAEKLYLKSQAGLFDVSAAGALEGAADSNVEAFVFTWIRDVVRPRIRLPRWSTSLNRQYEDSFAALMKETLTYHIETGKPG